VNVFGLQLPAACATSAAQNDTAFCRTHSNLSSLDAPAAAPAAPAAAPAAPFTAACSILPREEVMSGFVDKFKQFHTRFMDTYGPHKNEQKQSNGASSNNDAKH
jgi:hypothetical protein